MPKSMFITAAPVGAVPKQTRVDDPKFVSEEAVADLNDREELDGQLTDLMQEEGWQEIQAGGLEFMSQSLSNGASIPGNKLAELRKKAAFETTALLTTQGWISDGSGGLALRAQDSHSYLPPSIAESIRNNRSLARWFETMGWQDCGAGHWFPAKGCSPHLPVHPQEIVEEALHCFQAEAAIVHLHTRNLNDEQIVRFDTGRIAVRLGKQENYIDTDQYDEIVPAIAEKMPDGLLNISTSVRGSQADFDSPLRRAPLKPYGAKSTVPDIASYSPGPVRFARGGGYNNSPNFLKLQAAHMRHFGIRPEVEVFNQTIVNNATGPYASLLKSCGEPVLFMLVACVDQTTKSGGHQELDDSLVSSELRQRVCIILRENNPDSQYRAISLLVNSLSPTVHQIRTAFPEALVSILLPGPFQAIIAEVAVALGLDGVRVGLEDSLTIPDATLPGGSRKARGTWEQVLFTRARLEAQGVSLTTREELRTLLRQGQYA